MCLFVFVYVLYNVVFWCQLRGEIRRVFFLAVNATPPGKLFSNAGSFQHMLSACKIKLNFPTSLSVTYFQIQFPLLVCFYFRLLCPRSLGGALSDDAVWRLSVCRVHRRLRFSSDADIVRLTSARIIIIIIIIIIIRTLIGNHTRSIAWYNFQWPWVTFDPDFKVTTFFDIEYIRNDTR